MAVPNTPIAKHRALTLAIIGVVILLLAGFVLWERRDSPYISKFLGTGNSPTTTTAEQQFINRATYTCNQAKTITASYYDRSVGLVLSDGRSMTLPQTISGSGVRYANADESIIFWNKGNTAFIEEGKDQTQTYVGCVTTAATPENTAPVPEEEGVTATPSDMAPVR